MALKRLPTLPFLPAAPAGNTYASQLNLAINSLYRHVVQSVDDMFITASNSTLFPAASGGKRFAYDGTNLYIDPNTNSWISVGGGGATFKAGVTGGHTSSTTGTVSGSLFLFGGNNITLSNSIAANAMSVTISAPDTTQFLTISSFAAGMSTTAGGGSAGLTGTAVSNLYIYPGTGITISGTTAAAGVYKMTISGPTAMSINPVGNTQGVIGAQMSSGIVTMSAGSGITISKDTNAMTLIAGTKFHSLAISGNTGGVASTYSTGTIILSAGANLTISQGNQTLSFIGADAQSLSFGLGTGNTSGVSASKSISNLQVDGTGEVTVSATTGAGAYSLTIQGNTVSMSSYLVPDGLFPHALTVGAGPGNAIPIYAPIRVNRILNVSSLDQFFSIGQASAVGSSQANKLSISAAIYNIANPMVLQSSASTNIAWTVTGATRAGTSVKRAVLPWTIQIPVGEYILALWSSTSSSGNALARTHSQLVANAALTYAFGDDITSSTTTAGNIMIRGFATAASAAAGHVGTVSLTNLTGAAAFSYPLVHLRAAATI